MYYVYRILPDGREYLDETFAAERDALDYAGQVSRRIGSWAVEVRDAHGRLLS